MTESRRLDVEMVVEMNDDLCAETGEHSSLLDRSGLDAALARPWSGFGDYETFPTVYEKAAALLHGIAARQVFENGNKRAAWTAAVTFLDVNGIDIGSVEAVQSDMFVRAAALDHALEIGDLAEWFEVAVTQNQKGRATIAHDIHLPEHLVGGTDASGWRVSSTADTFMLDFIVADDRLGGADLIAIDRVRVPAYVIGQMMSTLDGQWNAYLGRDG